MALMREDALISRVTHLSGFPGRADAMRAIRATLVALGERLRDEERAALERELPASLRSLLNRAAYTGDFDRNELFARVARHGGLDRGCALEYAEVVCSALAMELPWESLTRLRRELGPSIASLLVEPLARRTTATAPSPPSGSTLASGRPGSGHPLSEARLDRAQTGSVARTQNPHVDTKLSSSRGLTQERLEETLASGHPGAVRSLAETKE
jgi:uncharacterized protein (DUF2267 family)